jgi:hypothetical protein
MSQTTTINEEFLRTLSFGLHKLAQPLSVISGYLELSLDGGYEEPSRELTERLLEESRRASGIAQFVMQLTRFQLPAADAKEILLSDLLECALADISRMLEEAEVRIAFERPEGERPVRVSPLRLREAMFRLLDAIRVGSVAGDVIRIDLLPESNRLTMLIFREQSMTHSSRAPVSDEYAPGNRAFALVQAVVSTAGGTFAGSLEPLFIRAEFPLR